MKLTLPQLQSLWPLSEQSRDELRFDSLRIQQRNEPVVRPEFAAEAQRIRELREWHAAWIRSTRRSA